MNKAPTQFWMVYGIGQGTPHFIHPTRDSATVEAQRLARVHHDVIFVVLEAVEAIVKREFSTFTYRADGRAQDADIPF